MREIAAAAYDAAARFDQLDAADAEATYRRLRAAAAELKSIPTKLYIGANGSTEYAVQEAYVHWVEQAEAQLAALTHDGSSDD